MIKSQKMAVLHLVSKSGYMLGFRSFIFVHLVRKYGTRVSITIKIKLIVIMFLSNCQLFLEDSMTLMSRDKGTCTSFWIADSKVINACLSSASSHMPLTFQHRQMTTSDFTGSFVDI